MSCLTHTPSGKVLPHWISYSTSVKLVVNQQC